MLLKTPPIAETLFSAKTLRRSTIHLIQARFRQASIRVNEDTNRQRGTVPGTPGTITKPTIMTRMTDDQHKQGVLKKIETYHYSTIES